MVRSVHNYCDLFKNFAQGHQDFTAIKIRPKGHNNKSGQAENATSAAA
jgi:hypothetical protein